MMPGQAFEIIIFIYNKISALFNFPSKQLPAKYQDSACFCQMPLQFLAKINGGLILL